MLNTLKRVISNRKTQTFAALAGLLIVGAALFSFTTAHQSNTFRPRTTSSSVLGDCTGSGPGLVLIWGGGSKEQTDITNDCWLHDGQIVFNWSTVEGSNCANQPESCFNWTDTDGNNLSSELQFYHSQGKQATIQLNSDSMPSWLVSAASSGHPGGTGEVASCGTYGLKYSPGNPLVPAYWNPSSNSATNALNSTYATALQNALTSLANAINGSADKSSVLSIRTAFDLIGTEHFSESESEVTLYSPQASGNAPTGCGGYTNTLANEAAAEVQDMYYNTFLNIGIHPMMRPEVISSSGPGQYFNSTFFPGGETSYLSPSKAWVFQTSADPDNGGNTNTIWVNYVKTGITIAYAEQLLAAGGQNGNTVYDALSWEWWRELMDLSRGTSYIATYDDDVESDPGASFFGQSFFQNFANSYAGHNSATTESSSPGAWIAFAGPSSPFGGDLGLFMTETAHTGNLNYYDISDSGNNNKPLGTGQPYGRYATEIQPGGSITVSLDSHFPRTGAADLEVWYYDSGSGQWSISGGSVNQSVTKANSSTWKTATFSSTTVPGTITLNVPSSASATYFHLVELTKTGNSPPPTCSANPTVSMTAPTSGATVNGASVPLSATASAAANCTLSQVAFTVGSTNIGTVKSAPFNTTWNSTSVADGSYTLTATATDTSGHSATSSVTVVVDNTTGTNPNPGGGGNPPPTSPPVSNGGTVTIAPNTVTPVSGTITLAPTLPAVSAPVGSPDYIIKVTYTLDGTLIATENKAPYAYHLDTDNYLNGVYTLTVRTYYESGVIITSTQKLIINNPFSLHQVGLFLVHYSLIIGIILVILIAITGFLFWWTKLHSPGGRIAVVLATIGTTIASLIHRFPPWNHPTDTSGMTNSGADIGSGITAEQHNTLDDIPNPVAPDPGQVIEPTSDPDQDK
jgi:Big-like domain-containing protein